jgi:hypothetical protein
MAAPAAAAPIIVKTVLRFQSCPGIIASLVSVACLDDRRNAAPVRPNAQAVAGKHVNIHAADRLNNRVQVFDHDGNFAR